MKTRSKYLHEHESTVMEGRSQASVHKVSLLRKSAGKSQDREYMTSAIENGSAVILYLWTYSLGRYCTSVRTLRLLNFTFLKATLQEEDGSSRE
jgi:hypothetical protein